MKICGKCGAHNSDKNFFCVDCNEKLDDPISAKDEERIENSIDQRIEKLYDKTDPLAITIFDKIIGCVCILGIVTLVILFFIALFKNRSLEVYYVGFVFFIFGALDALVPQITWTLEKLRLSFTISDPENAEPSQFYVIFRKIGITICAVIGIIMISTAVFQLCQKAEAASDNAETYGNQVIVQHGDEYNYISFEQSVG